MSLLIFLAYCVVLYWCGLTTLSDFGLICIGLGLGALLALLWKERKQ